jgi:hypothetical protein
MTRERPRVSTAVALAAGVLLGWLLAGVPGARLRAQGGDRSGGSAVATGPIMVRYDDRLKVPIVQDALYYLDYKGGRLVATVPTYQASTGDTRLIDTFAERDLVADFKLDLETGPRPHFMMTTGSIGGYSDGWAPLFVVETETNQVATYRVQQQSVGTNNRPGFELVDLRPIPPAAVPPASR